MYCQSDGISGSSRICPNFNCNYTYREHALAWLSTPKLCAVMMRCAAVDIVEWALLGLGWRRRWDRWKAERHARLSGGAVRAILRGDERSHTSECSLDSKSNEQLLYISRPPKSLPCLPQSATIYHII